MAQDQRRTGFSLTEMLIVIAIIAILALMAGPALVRLVPVQRLRGDAQNVAAFMRQARLRAASTQKPVRVSLACPQARGGPNPCRLDLETAVYEVEAGGQVKVKGWGREVDKDNNIWAPNISHELARPVFVAPARIPPTGDGGPTPEGVYWMIFMPTGRAFSFPRPFVLHIHADDLRGEAGPGWALAVDNGSGRTALNPIGW